jgi:hypothetical protein
VKEKFQTVSSRREKIRILTALPQAWSARKIAKEFGVTRHTATLAKKVKTEKGVLAYPDPKKGNPVDAEVAKRVQEFYLLEEISGTVPEGKYAGYGSVSGSLRFMCCALREAFGQFHKKFPNLKIGFSKFAAMRPEQCVLSGQSGPLGL